MHISARGTARSRWQKVPPPGKPCLRTTSVAAPGEASRRGSAHASGWHAPDGSRRPLAENANYEPLHWPLPDNCGTLRIHEGGSAARSAAPERGRPPVQSARAPRHVHSASRLGSFQTDRKSTRLNSSHMSISYAVFCLKKKKQTR